MMPVRRHVEGQVVERKLQNLQMDRGHPPRPRSWPLAQSETRECPRIHSPGMKRMERILARFRFMPIALLLAAALTCPVAGWGQAPAEPPSEKTKQLVALLNDPEILAWLKKGPAPAFEPAPSPADMLAAWEAALRRHISGLADAVPRAAPELASAADTLMRDVNGGRPGLVALILAASIMVGLGVEWLVRRTLAKRAAAGDGAPKPAMAMVMTDLAALLAFALASLGAFLAFEWPPLLHRVVLTLLIAVIAFRVVRALCKPAATPCERASGTAHAAGSGADPDAGPVASDHASARFRHRRISLMAGITLFGWAAVSSLQSLGVSSDVAELVAYLWGLGLLAAAIEAVWRHPGEAASRSGRISLTLFLTILWLLWAAGMLGLLWLGIYALLLPGLLRGAGRLAQDAASSYRPSGAPGIVYNILVARGIRALVLAAAVAWLAYLWRFSAGGLAGGEFGARLVGGLLNGIIILVMADLAWQLAKELIAYRLKAAEQAGGGEQAIQSGRLHTLLPILRNALAVSIVVIAGLTILSGMGVQILPLIAGAGVVGVAIGFGSQTLVKDILSGVFYMLDDAFRVGEYIQSGSYKGTVESFSLRSIRLRHHRGPVYTVPFGQLGAIQNMSRDWVIEKMTVGVTYDSDIDLARKLIKTIGQELAADPEFSADIIEPLKMQGIENFGEYAIVLRMKLMTKPGTQFTIKRRAHMMIKQAFEANGVKIAFPTVRVEGSGEAAAAAAHQILEAQRQEPMASS